MRQKRAAISLISVFFLTIILLIPSISIALDKESYYSNQKNSTSPNSASDPVIDPFINWPLFYAVQQTGMIDAGFDSFGRFGFNESTPSADPWSFLNTKNLLRRRIQLKNIFLEVLFGLGLLLDRIPLSQQHLMDGDWPTNLNLRTILTPGQSISPFHFQTFR